MLSRKCAKHSANLLNFRIWCKKCKELQKGANGAKCTGDRTLVSQIWVSLKGCKSMCVSHMGPKRAKCKRIANGAKCPGDMTLVTQIWVGSERLRMHACLPHGHENGKNCKKGKKVASPIDGEEQKWQKCKKCKSCKIVAPCGRLLFATWAKRGKIG